MGRAAHNWKRRAKLIEKHTGRTYDPGRTYGKKVGAGTRHAWAAERSWSHGDGYDWADDQTSKVARNRMPSDTKERRAKKRKGSQVSSSAEQPTSTKIRKTRKRLVKREIGAEELEQVDSQEKKRKRKVKVKSAIGSKDTGGSASDVRKPTRAQLRREWKRAREQLRHQAYIVCPGSVTDRFAKGGEAHSAVCVPLRGQDRKLLASGGLSWRWLREEFDYPDLPPRHSPPEVNDEEYQGALEEAQRSSPVANARRLRQLDHLLGAEAQWPPCGRRVSLASKLCHRNGLQRRCARYFDEVLRPLFDNELHKSACEVAPLLAVARSLCVQCAEDWCGEALSASSSVRLAWLQMLRASMVLDDSASGAAMDTMKPWLLALRAAFLGRLSPLPDPESQVSALERVASLAAGATTNSQKYMNSDGESLRGDVAVPAVVLLPLGVFTRWQVLLLVGLARRHGAGVTVVRRGASGAAKVLFRSS